MFTVGLFTTHFPYLVFIACYAWFMLFGVEQAQEGKIQLTEKSVQIEYHVNHAKATAEQYSAFYKLKDFDFVCHKNYAKLSIFRKWKIRDSLHFCSQSVIPVSLFCRPPPAQA